MAIPPFPSQDLAKLVLGYLAEEHLMTAYDEFLQASPYLDALSNEFDRIFMTSLKSILAEYRAVKIFVQTCSPFVLRKRLFQCPNLLEIVKFLIHNVDINKLQLQEATEKASFSSDRQNISLSSKSNTCEVCSTSKLPNCVCKKQSLCDSQHSSNVETSHTSVETTPLADLPGNYITSRRKQVKVLEKDSHLSYNASSGHSNTSSAVESHSSMSVQPSQVTYNHSVKYHDSSVTDVNLTAKFNDSSESRQKLEEFNDVLKSVQNKQMVPANSFQDFATGVSDGENQNINVPDSSTSENLNAQTSLTKDYYNDNIKGPPLHHKMLIEGSKNNSNVETQNCKSTMGSKVMPKLLPKSDEQKIKIISDVKVGTKFNSKLKENTRKKGYATKNATSTPLMQMQTIVINGTPAYKRSGVNAQNFTKDEIMAMPTLIVVPASAPPKVPTTFSQPVMSQSCISTTCNTVPSPKLLGPLVIDVPSSLNKKPDDGLSMPNLSTAKPPAPGLITTVDITKNASVPKDSGATVTLESNTPHMLPPTRKSSSTPRRTSHVRVLDFTTPRRILHETINEQVTSQCSNASIEIVLSGSPSVTHTLTTAHAESSTQDTIVTYSANASQKIEICNGPAKENSTINLVKPAKGLNWDANLRATAISNENPPPKPKPKRSRKKKPVENDDESTKVDGKKAPENKIKSPKIKKRTKKKQKIEEEEGEVPELANKKEPLKPTINIVIGNGTVTTVPIDNMKPIESTVQNKSHEDVEIIDTPEAERLSLQNVIGAKLNLSDLLETPYKQALYDIQMETPRFLGPDLPDEPISDIKIMNIPTPRFLNTPKAVQATPSSYSSRPTDYSSGGSYYKPDDQDYILIPDLGITEKASKPSTTESKSGKTDKERDVKKSRPVRQCTKNVSYRNSRKINKSKETEDNTDAASSCSDSQSICSLEDSKTDANKSNIKPSRAKKISNVKPEPKKRNSVARKQKSPIVKEAKFIKIKPRQTPTKLTPMGRKKAIDNNSPNTQRKKRLSKDKTLSTTPLVSCVPTKSRRKSSTPRKLPCSKTFTLQHQNTSTEIKPTESTNPADSDTDQMALRWSDDGSQDAKAHLSNTNPGNTSEVEDINQIKQFIEVSQVQTIADNDISFKASLVRRGFDVETARSIERDLLDTEHVAVHSVNPERRVVNLIPPITVEIVETKKESSLEKTLETDSSVTNELQIVQDDDDNEEGEIELSVHECDEDTANYFVYQYDETKEPCHGYPTTLKDKFSMEVCIDEEVTVRLRANPFTLLFDQDPLTEEQIALNNKETEMAVNYICNMDRLNTPYKEAIKAQCYNIFDSTLTSLDTPLKSNSPRAKDNETTVTELVQEEEKNDDKVDPRKRKRSQISPEGSNADNKKAKNETDYLFKSTNIQNIDIETVLTKLHGP